MKTALIGYTGFVGGNLNRQYEFTDCYNTKNIHEICGKEYDLLICAGVKAQKWYANQHEAEDYRDIFSLTDILSQTTIKKFVLISSIDVYPKPFHVDEDANINTKEADPYGRNRRLLEEYIEKNYQDHHIVRLPGLFGYGLKKNFIYDTLTQIPSALNMQKWNELKNQCSPSEVDILTNSYRLENDIYYYNQTNRNSLLPIVQKYQMTSLMFTDCRDVFQMYPLELLWSHIEKVIQNDIPLINLACAPLSAKDIYQKLYHLPFENQLSRSPVQYDIHTKYDKLFGGNHGYILCEDAIITYLRKFIGEYAI